MAGAFFTWLAGKEGRDHAAQLAREAERAAEWGWLRTERKNAYLALLRIVRINIYRMRYEREEQRGKLRDLEAKWPRGDRYSLDIEATNLTRLFGSEEASQLLQRTQEDDSRPSEQKWRQFHQEVVRLIRQEFDIDLLAHVSRDADKAIRAPNPQSFA